MKMKIIIILTALTLTSWSLFLFNLNKQSKEKMKDKEEEEKERYHSKYGRELDIEIIKIRDCEYVLWHNGYGSDMEHYEGCKH